MSLNIDPARPPPAANAVPPDLSVHSQHDREEVREQVEDVAESVVESVRTTASVQRRRVMEDTIKQERQERYEAFLAGEAEREKQMEQKLLEADEASVANFTGQVHPPAGSAAEEDLEVLKRRLLQSQARAREDQETYDRVVKSRQSQQGFTGKGSASDPLIPPSSSPIKPEPTPSVHSQHLHQSSSSDGYLEEPEVSSPVVFVDSSFTSLVVYVVVQVA
jgi:hypothetical protein